MSELLEHWWNIGVRRAKCPRCAGGDLGENSFVLRQRDDGRVRGTCYRATCGWYETTFALPIERAALAPFEPKPLKAPYFVRRSGGKELFGERALLHDASVTVWRLIDLNGRFTGHITRTADKKITTYKEVPDAVYYWNGLAVTDENDVWLFEDCMSAALCEEPAVALLGTSVPDILLEHLRTVKLNRVMVALDPGAEDAALRAHAKLRAAGFDATYVPMLEDFKDMKREDRNDLLEAYGS